MGDLWHPAALNDAHVLGFVEARRGESRIAKRSGHRETGGPRREGGHE